MALNDAMAFFFWWIYFNRFPAIGGWGLREMLLLWAVAATSFGVATAVFGNCHRLAALIAQGQLDYYLALPRNPLLHALVSRTSVPGWGDVTFGLIAVVAAGSLDPGSVALFVVLVAASTAIFVGFLVLVGSLAFFIGSAETAQILAQNALTMFGTYPGPMYRGWVKVLIYTAVPAGFAAHVPVELLRRFDPLWLGALLGFAVALWAATLVVFRAGLRRYESGSLIGLRG